MAVPDTLRTVPWDHADRLERRTPRDLQALYLDDVFRYVSAFIRPPAEAEDVTMETFHSAFASLGRMRRTDDPRLWLLGIARRKVADSLRKRYRRREEPLDSLASTGGTAPDIDQSLLVGEVLSQIPPDQREVLALKYVNELSLQEIAVVLGRSEAAVNSLLQRARQSFYAKGARHFVTDREDQR